MDLFLVFFTCLPGLIEGILLTGATDSALFAWIRASSCNLVSWTVLFLKSLLLDLIVGSNLKLIEQMDCYTAPYTT